MQNRIDILCDLVSNKEMERNDLANFLDEEKVDLNMTHSVYGIRATECAASSGNLAVFSLLLNLATPTDIHYGLLDYNLMEWASENSPDILTYLLAPQERWWQFFHDGTTDLHAHAMSGRLYSVKPILQTAPKRLNETSNNLRTPLFWAGLAGKEEIVSYLIAQGALTLPEQPTAYDFQVQAANKQGLGHLQKKLKSYPKALKHYDECLSDYDKAQALFTEKTSQRDYALLYRNRASIENEKGNIYHFLGCKAKKTHPSEAVEYFDKALESFQSATGLLQRIPDNIKTLRITREIDLLNNSIVETTVVRKQCDVTSASPTAVNSFLSLLQKCALDNNLNVIDLNSSPEGFDPAQMKIDIEKHKKNNDWHSIGLLYLNKVMSSPARNMPSAVKTHRAMFDNLLDDLKESKKYFEKALAVKQDNTCNILRDLIKSISLTADIHSQFAYVEMECFQWNKSIDILHIALKGYEESLQMLKTIPQAERSSEDLSNIDMLFHYIINIQSQIRKGFDGIAQTALEAQEYLKAYSAFKEAYRISEDMQKNLNSLSLDELKSIDKLALEQISITLTEIKTRIDFLDDLLGFAPDKLEEKMVIKAASSSAVSSSEDPDSESMTEDQQLEAAIRLSLSYQPTFFGGSQEKESVDDNQFVEVKKSDENRPRLD